MNARFIRLAEALSQAESLIELAIRHLADLNLGPGRRAQLSGLLWQLAVQDGRAIAILIRARLVGSARALLRPQLEAMARGAWAKVLATDGQLEAYAMGHAEPPPIGQLISRLAAHSLGWTFRGQRLPLDNLWRQAGSAFHDSTHRGTSAVARTSLSNTADEDYVGGDEISILYLAAVATAVAATSLLEEAGQTDEATEIWARADEVLQALEHISNQDTP